jgi:hypothetical protein
MKTKPVLSQASKDAYRMNFVVVGDFSGKEIIDRWDEIGKIDKNFHLSLPYDWDYTLERIYTIYKETNYDVWYISSKGRAKKDLMSFDNPLINKCFS